MKVLIKVIAVVLVAVLMISTTITAYAGQLPENQEEVEISAEEKSVLDGDINEAEVQSENEIADDTDSEEFPEDQEEIEIPAEDVSDEDITEAEDQTEEAIEDDCDIEDDYEFPEETMLEDGAAIGASTKKPWVADGDCKGTVRINGGNVSLCLQNVVLKDKQDNDVHIIGHGFGGEKDGDLFIDSSMKVWFEGKDLVPQNKRTETCHSFSNQWLHIGVR